MSKKLPTIWALEPHTEAKHKILQAYFGAWFSIVGQYFDHPVFVDGFAGPGEYAGGEPGSPLLVLREMEKALTRPNLKLRHGLKAELWFIEEDRARKENLDQRIAAVTFSDPRLTVHPPVHGAFEQHIKTIIAGLPAVAGTPLLVFIDPFGAKGFSMATIEQILRRGTSEVFLLLDVDGIDRLLMAWDEHSNKDIVMAIFGIPEAELLEIKALPGGQKDRIPKLRQLYSSALKRRKIARGILPFQMFNGRGLLYDLVFLTNHELGFIRMKESMWKADSTGDFRFSDAEAEQAGLPLDFSPADRLWPLLYKEFQGKTISGKTVNDFVNLHTRFLQPHKTEALRKHEAADCPVESRIGVAGRKPKGPRGYPDHVQITFPAQA